MIVPNYYENLQVLHENTMPYRAYYIPASKPMGTLVHDREKSDRFQWLNGDWKFKYYKSIYDLQEEFYREETLTETYDEIPVPGIWQNYGYDSHQYTNVRYPIPLDPPYVPQENPCGTYIHEFDYSKEEKAPKAYLNFEGVDSCFYVWMNGQYVGYSQVSHATAEFDVTEFMRDGKNRLAVLVLKWCDGTYLEDQDKFRMTGIFRDVYILKRPENILYDYFTTTKINGTDAEIEIRANFVGEGNIAENMNQKNAEMPGEASTNANETNENQKEENSQNDGGNAVNLQNNNTDPEMENAVDSAELGTESANSIESLNGADSGEMTGAELPESESIDAEIPISNDMMDSLNGVDPLNKNANLEDMNKEISHPDELTKRDINHNGTVEFDGQIFHQTWKGVLEADSSNGKTMDSTSKTQGQMEQKKTAPKDIFNP